MKITFPQQINSNEWSCDDVERTFYKKNVNLEKEMVII